jgi:hypothetical protein
LDIPAADLEDERDFTAPLATDLFSLSTSGVDGRCIVTSVSNRLWEALRRIAERKRVHMHAVTTNDQPKPRRHFVIVSQT